MWLSTKEVAAELRVSSDTVGNWMNGGVNGPDGRRVILQSQRIGGRYKVKKEWLEAFLAACNGDDLTPIPTPAAQKRRERDRDEALRALGVLR